MLTFKNDLYGFNASALSFQITHNQASALRKSRAEFSPHLYPSMRLYGKVKANLRLSPAKLQEKTCKRSEKCKVNTVSRLAKDFLFHVCQCDLFDSHTVSSSFLSISIVNTKIKSHWFFFVQDDQSDSDCCSLSHSGELRGHFSSSHSDASARNAPQKTAFLRFTEICLCLMQFKAVQSNNPSLGALTLGHKRHHNNNTNGTERRQLSTPVPTGSLPIANMDE